MQRKLERKGKVTCPEGVPWVSRGQKSQKKDNKMAILCNLQAKIGPHIGYRKRMHQYWKDDGLRNILKTGKLSKVEIERLKRQIKQFHVDSVECETGQLDRSDEEVVTQYNDNLLLQGFIVGASCCVEDTRVSESASDVTKRLKLLLKNPKNDPIPSLRSTNGFRLKQETEEVTKAMSSITLNDISDFKNLIKAGAISVCERMGIRKSVKLQQEPFWKRRTESDITRLRKDCSRQDDWLKGEWKKDKK